MRQLTLRAGGASSPYLLGSGLLARTGELVNRSLARSRCALIADANLESFAAVALGSLRSSGIAVSLFSVAGGDGAKSLGEVSRLCEQFASAGLDRSAFVVSLGGGAVGDLAGFAASIFLRGVPHVLLPTTLLAQIDSSIGGKTAVNLSAGKNLVGTFHQPAVVIADTDTLQSLPERIWNEGFAEAIKHAIIRDAELLPLAGRVERENAEEFIARNVAIKSAVVAADEREETGARSILNFGHTIGHAIENAAGYGNILHGEAISLGMLAAARISVRRAGFSLGQVEQIAEALRARRLPTCLPPDFRREKILQALPRDKKFVGGRIRFIVAETIGRARISEEVTMEDLKTAIDEL